jgi:hypothetical protein
VTAARNGIGQQQIVPNPDPSALTGAAIDRAVSNAVTIQDAKVSAINIRIEGMEKAVTVFQADLTRVPTQLDRAILSLRELLESIVGGLQNQVNGRIDTLDAVTTEKFVGVGSQFAERDTRTDQRAGDTKLAVDAAFAAAKEATAKIETGFTKQIDAMSNIIDTKTSNLAGGMSDLKERLTALEARTQGISSGRTDTRAENADTRGFIFNIAGFLVSFGMLLAAVFVHFSR